MTPLAFAESLVEAFAASDAERYFAHFHPDATFLFHDTPALVANRAAYEAMWPSGWPRPASRCSSASPPTHASTSTATSRSSPPGAHRPPDRR